MTSVSKPSCLSLVDEWKNQSCCLKHSKLGGSRRMSLTQCASFGRLKGQKKVLQCLHLRQGGELELSVHAHLSVSCLRRATARISTRERGKVRLPHGLLELLAKCYMDSDWLALGARLKTPRLAPTKPHTYAYAVRTHCKEPKAARPDATQTRQNRLGA